MIWRYGCVGRRRREGIDDEQTARHVTADARRAGRRVLGEIVSLYWESGIGDDVPALAWFLASSLVPLALGVTALATLLLGDSARAQELASHMAEVLPKDVHDQVVALILRTKHDSPLLLIGAVVGMVWTSSGAIGVLSRVLTRLLSRPGEGIVIGKLRNLGLAAALATLIVLMVSVASAGTGLVHRLGLDPVLTRLAVPLIAVALTLAICAGLYWALTAGTVTWRSALAGGLVGAVILLATPTAAGYYVGLVAGRGAVGVFLVLAGLFITCYLAAAGMLIGAGVTVRVDLGHRIGSASGS